MNNLTTRRIILGLLMTLVLAFGVQGIAGAVRVTIGEAPATFKDSRARQLRRGGIDEGDGGGGGISFTPMLEDTEGNPGVGNHEADPLPSGTDTTNTIESITVTPSGIQFTVPTFTTSTITFSESTTAATATTNNQPLTANTINLQGYFTRVGAVTLTITYTDLANSQANDDNQALDAANTAGTNYSTSRSVTRTYTYYVVESDDSIPKTTVLQLSRDGSGVSSEGYITNVIGNTDFYISTNNSGNYPVTYSVGPTTTPPARLYAGTDPYTNAGTSPGTISSSSGTKVWLDMNGNNMFTVPGTTRL